MTTTDMDKSQPVTASQSVSQSVSESESVSERMRERIYSERGMTRRARPLLLLLLLFSSLCFSFVVIQRKPKESLT
eukprot:scaffold5218_cov150-Ochromonas_danica.AAC.14